MCGNGNAIAIQIPIIYQSSVSKPICLLSENTVRILQKTFGEVVISQEENMTAEEVDNQ
jgi:hypothetical protein